LKEIIITANEAGQRFDKLLAKYLKEAPKSFFYKMLRKKNITLNGKKAQGNEMLQTGDTVRLFLSDETIAKFQGQVNELPPIAAAQEGKAGDAVPLAVVYEDEDILLINKPAGMLTQKAVPQDVSLNEYMLQYLIANGSIRREELTRFRPSVCNRLDRNTSGLVVAGKSLIGLQTMSRMLKERSMHKYYRCIVKGEMSGNSHLKGYLVKDERTNRVRIADHHRDPKEKMVETEYRTIQSAGGLTLLEVHLITGRSHQIRAHLSSIGHPILGDPKYGDAELNQRYRRKYGVKYQLLHAYCLEFPDDMEALTQLSGQVFYAELPKLYGDIMRSVGAN
jgi:23S rRNA pseudouridine955/2504/2580 synthase